MTPPVGNSFSRPPWGGSPRYQGPFQTADNTFALTGPKAYGTDGYHRFGDRDNHRKDTDKKDKQKDNKGLSGKDSQGTVKKAPAGIAQDTWDKARHFLAKLNAKRKRAGKNALKLDPKLCKLCRESDKVPGVHHRGASGRMSRGHARGEVVAGSSNPDQALAMWDHSPGHHAILWGSGTRLGVDFLNGKATGLVG